MSEEITKDFKRIAPKRWKRYPRYKDSGVEWIGEIPEEWKNVRLKHLTKKIGSGITPRGGAESYLVSGIPLIRSQNVQFEGLSREGLAYISDEQNEKMINSKALPNDVLLNITGASIGRTCMVPQNMGQSNVNQHVCIIRPKKSSFSQFIWRFLSSHVGQIQVFEGEDGISREGLNFERIKNFVITLPPDEDIERIAAYLDRDSTAIISLISKKQRLIELLKEKRAAIITRAVTKGLDPNAPMKDSGVEWIGEMPKHWNIGLIKQGYQVTLGKMLQPNKRSENDFEAPYLRSANIQDGFVDTSEIKTMYFNKSEDHLLLEEGDLLVCEGGDVGRAAIWSNQVSNCRFQNSINRIRSKTNSVRYLFYLLKASKRSGFIDFLCNRATISHFTAEKVKGLRIVYPDMTEQLKIANYLDKETSRMNSFISKIEKSIELLKEYRSALITAAVTGKIDVREEVP